MVYYGKWEILADTFEIHMALTAVRKAREEGCEIEVVLTPLFNYDRSRLLRYKIETRPAEAKDSQDSEEP